MGGMLALSSMADDPAEETRVAALKCIGHLAHSAHSKGSGEEPKEVRRALAIAAPILEMHRKWGEPQVGA